MLRLTAETAVPLFGARDVALSLGVTGRAPALHFGLASDNLRGEIGALLRFGLTAGTAVPLFGLLL